MEYKYPWQSTPAELIKHALDLLRQDDENNRQIAFLLFDVGVETIFKTFLLLPELVTGVTTSYTKRVEATEGSFKALLDVVKESAKNKLTSIDLDKIMYYHSIRNKLYHQGDGIIPKTTNIQDYASIAVEVLYCFLNVDLHPLLSEEQEKKELIKKKEELIKKRRNQIKQEFEPLQNDLKNQCLEEYHYLKAKLMKEYKNEFECVNDDAYFDKVDRYINKLSSHPKGRSWKSAIRRFVNEGFSIIDDSDNLIVCVSLDELTNPYEFVIELANNSPLGLSPIDVETLVGDFYSPEIDWLNILIADDMTEALIIMTQYINNFTPRINADNYYDAKRIFNWDYEKEISDDGFENKLQKIMGDGKRLLQLSWKVSS